MTDYDLVCIMAAILRARQTPFAPPDDHGRPSGIPSAIDEAIEIAARVKDLVKPSGVQSWAERQKERQLRMKQAHEQGECDGYPECRFCPQPEEQ